MPYVRCGNIRFTIVILLLLASLLPVQPARAAIADGPVVCVDPGHQRRGNNELEPVAPDTKTMKPKVSSGTSGVYTKKPEYVLTLEASLLLKEKLESYGYAVVMTRETHDVDISNAERAQLCNEAGADLAVRIHADGSSSPQAQGISLLYPSWTESNASIYARSKEAAEIILKESVAATGAVSRGTVPRSDLTGFNWSTVPSVLIEMGFMTNAYEDQKLSDPEYLNQLTEGIAAGVNKSLAVAIEEPEVAEEFVIELPNVTYLYERTNNQLVRTRLALSPQSIQISATSGEWGKVQTWEGEKWLYVGDRNRS